MPEGYCIDSTEVTRDQYQAWLAKSPSVTQQDAILCGWNTTFQPDPICMASSSVCQAGCGTNPQVCVDWCDAAAYCKGVGKRLCGKLGGGPNAYTDFTNPSASQWYNACSSHGVSTYPYGSSYNSAACNGADIGAGTTMATALLARCQSPVSGYAGVFDLSGNVWEWEDSCNQASGQLDNCRLRGGSFDYFYDYLTCIGDYSDTRNMQDRAIGLRCCSP
jgi:formylglycine-generating enzyme required for sulfatase activity